MSLRIRRLAVAITSFAALAVAAFPASAALVNVSAPGNLLALLPSADLNASSVTNFGPNTAQLVDNFVNTATQDNGQIFADSDSDQRIAVTGFNSQIGDLRFYLGIGDPVRFPGTLTAYYSTLSTTSLDPSNSAYTATNGGTLVSTLVLTPALLTPVAGDPNSGYFDLAVNAPVGTKTLLLDVGPANGFGDRISELQAFAVPEPTSLALVGVSLVCLGYRRRRDASLKA